MNLNWDYCVYIKQARRHIYLILKYYDTTLLCRMEPYFDIWDPSYLYNT